MRKSRYQFLSRKERQAIDFVTAELLLGLLESGDVSTFNTIIGVIQDLKDVAGRVSGEHERCLRLPLGRDKGIQQQAQKDDASSSCAANKPVFSGAELFSIMLRRSMTHPATYC